MYRFLFDFPCMRTSDPTSQLPPGAAVRTLLGAFVECIVSGNSKLVTAWPRSIDAPAILHQMAVLWHVVGDDDEGQVGARTEDFTRLATLVWPFTNDSLRKMGGMIAHRNIILPRNKLHINRKEQCCYSYHIQLRRIGDLNPDKEIKRTGRLLTLQEHDELQHPSFAEISPILVMDTDGTPLHEDCRNRFMGRVRKYTLIKVDKTPSGLFDLPTTPYILLCLQPGTDMKKTLSRAIQARRPDVLLLDLHAAANIHGDEWPDKACELLRWTRIYAAKLNQPFPPVFAIADTPWLAYQFSRDVMPSYDKNARLPEQGVLNISRDVLSQAVYMTSGSRNPTMVVTCLARYLTPFLVEADGLQKALEPLDVHMSNLVREMMHFIRRMICLPGGIDAYNEFVEQCGRKRFVPGQPLAMAADLLSLEQNGRAGKESGRVKDFVQQFLSTLESLKEITPGSDLFRRLRTTEVFTERGNTLLVLPDRTTESFTNWIIDTEGASRDNLDTTDGKHGIDHKMSLLRRYQKAYMLLPRWDTVARILVSHHAPEVLHLVCDEATVSSIRHQAAILMEKPAFRPVHERLDRLLNALDEALEGGQLPIPNIEEVRLTSSAVSSYEGGGKPMALRLWDGRIVPLFEGSSVVKYRNEAEPRPFVTCQASMLSPGDQVFLVDDDFFAMAEQYFTMKCDANAMLDSYHRQVLELREAVPGDGLREKARHVRKMMAAGNLKSLPDESTVVTWLDVERLIGAPLDEVRPQAPHSEEWFMSFTGAIGMLPLLAPSFWRFGVFDTRSRRISAGFNANRFCTALLTDPDSVMPLFSGDNDDLQRLEICARNEIAEIVEILKEEKD